MKPVVGAVLGLVIGAAATGALMTFAGNGGREDVERLARGGEGPGRGPGGAPQRGVYAPAVAMGFAEAATLGRRIDVIGEASALKSVIIVSEVSGFVDEVRFAPGKPVRKGDVILKLDDEAQRIALDRARAQFPIAEGNVQRFAGLAQDDAASAQEVEDAFNNFKAAEADMREAQFEVDRRAIRAPFDGRAGLTKIDPGDFINPNDTITTLDDVSAIVIAFSAPQEMVESLKIGQPVSATLASSAARRVYEGAVTAIDSRIDAETRALRVEATFDNADGRMLPGAVFSVSTTSEGEPAVAVPGLAIQWNRAGAFVWKRGLDGGAVRASVRILQRTDNMALVEGEIAVGDEVVFEGAERVRAGLPLPPAEASTKPTKAAAAGFGAADRASE